MLKEIKHQLKYPKQIKKYKYKLQKLLFMKKTILPGLLMYMWMGLLLLSD